MAEAVKYMINGINYTKKGENNEKGSFYIIWQCFTCGIVRM